jgi:predicted dehydrogenase
VTWKLKKTLGVGLIGAGFINSFHVRAWTRVRDADIKAVCDVKKERAESLALLCRDLNVGNPTVYTDVSRIANDPQVEAVWVGVPNFAKLDVVKTVVEEVTQGKASLVGICSEKPLARNVSEAEEMMRLVKISGMLHGYLENQAFAPSLLKAKEIVWKRGAKRYGRPYLARAAEEHGGPHEPWFWQGRNSGGGVLLDMMCHSYEAGRVLLTAPDEDKQALKPRTISAVTASLKWTVPGYVEKLKERTKGAVDYSKAACEDFARGNLTFETPDGRIAVVEATTSWSFVGAGLRLSFELLGPEYSLQINSLQPEAHVFFSRDVQVPPGEELIEKQTAEQGLMPVIADESYTYGYENEDAHMVQCFLKRTSPSENWDDGLLMVKLCMASYMAAERGRELRFPPEDLETYVPACARA